jgi:hypothetical protein
MKQKIMKYHLDISNDKRLFLFLIVNSMYFCSFLVITDNFKLMSILTFLVVLINYLLTNTILVSLLTNFVASLFYYLPAKLFKIELLSASEQTSDLFKEGLLGQFGLNISDLLAFAIVFFFIREFILNKIKFSTYKRPILLIGISWVLYSIWNSFNSLYYSWFSFYSLTLSLQSLKVVALLFAVYYLYENAQKYIPSFLYFLISITIVQSLLGLLQTVTFSSNTGSGFSQIPEESNFLIRPYGTIGYANPHALLITMLYSITSTYLLNSVTNKEYLVVLGYFRYVVCLFI